MPSDKKSPETLDEKVVAKEEAPTRYVKPYRDHGVESPVVRPPSVSQMAAQAQPISDAESENSVSGRLVQASFSDGEVTIRLAHATASMRALARLLAAQGLEVEIVVRRRAP